MWNNSDSNREQQLRRGNSFDQSERAPLSKVQSHDQCQWKQVETVVSLLREQLQRQKCQPKVPQNAHLKVCSQSSHTNARRMPRTRWELASLSAHFPLELIRLTYRSPNTQFQINYKVHALVSEFLAAVPPSRGRFCEHDEGEGGLGRQQPTQEQPHQSDTRLPRSQSVHLRGWQATKGMH